MSDRARELCLVVGGAGFFGRALVRRLAAEGRRVRVFDRVPPAEQLEGVEVVLGDLCDARAVDRAMRGVRSVLHTAALIELTGVARAVTRRRVMDVNVGGTRRLLESAVAHGAAHFVFTSSNNVCLGPAIVGGDERSPIAPRFVDLYSESKARAEQIVLPADGRGGLRTCVLRPGGIWGPGPGCLMLERFLAQVAKGRLWATIGDGGSVADNTHVDNLVDAHLLALRALDTCPEQAGGQAFFITDEEPMNPMDWFRPLCEALDVRLPERTLPASLMYGLGYAAEWIHYATGVKPALTRVEVLKVARSHSFRIDKARRVLGYEPRVTLAGGGILPCVPHARRFMADV